MMKFAKRIIVLGVVLVLSLSAYSGAQNTEVDEKTLELCNQVMQKVYDEIDQRKEKYEYLKLFTKLAYKTNEWGFRYIKYRYIHTVAGRVNDTLEFRVEFVPLGIEREHTFEGNHFEYPFPLLKVKLLVYQNAGRLNRQIAVHPFVYEHARFLNDYQSQFMPVRLNVYTKKENYQVGQAIDLVVILENLTEGNLKVKDLSSKSIAFTKDSKKWGVHMNRPHPKTGNEVLRAGRALKRRFRINGFEEAGDVAIHVNYLMNFSGAMPTNTLYLNIKE